MKKILIIRFSSIGDIVLTTPIIRCLKNQYPEAQISYLTKSEYTPILEANPFIEKIYSLQDDLDEIIAVLKKEHFDLIIDLHKNLRSLFVRIRLRRNSISFSKLNVRKWFKVNLKLNCLPDLHLVDRYFNALKPIGVVNDGLGLDYFISEKDKLDSKILPATFHHGFYAIIIGAKHFTKRFPNKKQIELINKLDLPVVLLGDENDFDDGTFIKEHTKNEVFNACGVLPINQSASLLRLAKKVITNDTGLMHIANALKKDVISLWGNTVPEFGMYPYQQKNATNSISYIQEAHLKCRPCSKIGYSKCPKGHFDCMRKIDVEKIIMRIKS